MTSSGPDIICEQPLIYVFHTLLMLMFDVLVKILVLAAFKATMLPFKN